MQQEAPEPSRDKIVNEVKQIMNKVFFKIREEFVVGDTYKGSSIISIVLNVIKVSVVIFLKPKHYSEMFFFVSLNIFLFVCSQTMTLKLTSGADESGEESEDESDDEGSEDEESGSEEGEISEKEEEGEISGKEEEGEISGKEEEGEEKKSEEIGSGKVESEQSEEDESEPQDKNKSIEIQSGKEESGVTESRKEEVKDNEEVQSGSDEEDESEKGDVSREEVKEEENGKEIQNEEYDGRRDPEKGEDEMKVEESVKAEDNGSKTEKGMVMDSDGREEVMKNTEEASEVPEDIVESPLLKYGAGEEEDEDEAEDLLVPPEDTGDDLGTPEGDTDHLGVMVARNTASSEEDLDNISNRPVLGSEHTSISSDEENERNNEDRNDQDNDSQEHLVPNLPNIGELSSTNKDMGASEGETKADGNVENTNENDQVENSEKEAEKNEVVPDEKNKEEKKVQSLAE